MERWESQILDLGMGLNVNNRHLSNLRFADDILLLAASQTDVIAMLEILFLELQDIGLILNANKMKILMTVLHNHSYVFLQDGSRIEVVEDYHSHKWLGKSICFTRGFVHYHAIDSRIAAATRVFLSLIHI